MSGYKNPLARTGRFVAYKETSCYLDKIRALLSVTADTPYLLEAVKAGASGAMSIASIWLPNLVGAVIARANSENSDAERVYAQLCVMEMVERAIHPL